MFAGCIGVHSSAAGSVNVSPVIVAMRRVAAAGAIAFTRTPYRPSSASAMIENVAIPVFAAP